MSSLLFQGLNHTVDNVTDYSNPSYAKLYTEYLHTELPIVYGLIGILLNVLLIIYFIKSGKYRIPTFTLLTNLAVFDALTCTSCIGYAVFLFPNMIGPEFGFTCTLLVTIAWLALNTSAYYLVFFAVLRFYQLAFPLLARARITCAFVMKLCLVIQLFSLAIAVGIGVHFTPLHVIYLGKQALVCMCTNVYVKDLLWNITTFSSCGAILILHVAKYIALYESSRTMGNNAREGEVRRNADAKAVTIVIVIFFATYFTPNIYSMIQYKVFDDYDSMNDNLFLLFLFVSFSNSTINPLVYCFAAKSVRDDIKVMCFKTSKMNHSKHNCK